MDIQAILDGIVKYLPVALQIVGAFAVLATMTANKVDDKVIGWLLKAINIIGMNVGTSRNSDDV